MSIISDGFLDPQLSGLNIEQNRDNPLTESCLDPSSPEIQSVIERCLPPLEGSEMPSMDQISVTPLTLEGNLTEITLPNLDISENLTQLNTSYPYMHEILGLIGYGLGYYNQMNVDSMLGLCRGVAYAGMIASLTEGGIQSFNDRMQYIHGLFQEKPIDQVISLINLPEIRSFFDTVFLFAFPNYNQEFFQFHDNLHNQRDRQSIQQILQITRSVAIEARGGIDNVTLFTGSYSPNELATVLAKIKDISIASATPVAIMIGTPTHAISITYNGVNWTFVDANQLPAKILHNEVEVVAYIRTAYTENSDDVFNLSMDLYTFASNAPKLHAQLMTWMNSDDFLRIHRITDQKQLSIENLSLWLEEAVASGDNITMLHLMQHLQELSSNLEEVLNSDDTIRQWNLSH